MQKIDPEFVAASRLIGADPLFIQGAGGNTSIKTASDQMWVKASGKWLAHAEQENVFVAVNQARIRDQVKIGVHDPLEGASIQEFSTDLRPSIETTLHALMPQKVVFHTHSINTIVHAVQQDAEAVLTGKLNGLDWAFIPYSKPGLPLTKLVAQALSNQNYRVLVIQNHGLVVSGETIRETLTLLRVVEDRLSTRPRPMMRSDKSALSRLCAGHGFVVPDCELSHQLALDPHSFEFASNGSLYPDHVVFLGSAIAGVETEEDFAECLNANSENALVPKVLALRSVGIVHRSDLSLGGREMLRALANVCHRLPEAADIRCLTGEEERELVNWDAERYRQTLA